MRKKKKRKEKKAPPHRVMFCEEAGLVIYRLVVIGKKEGRKEGMKEGEK